jgi:transketolase
MLLAQKHSLNNLIVSIDNNNSSNIKVDFGCIFGSFGFEICYANGHNLIELFDSITMRLKDEFPYAVIANTIKGNGCKSMENNPAWHHKSPNVEEYKKLLEELEL